jgi:Asp-tRNA(Asn)/Glu-tRNA(Gln) amidotransferase C subunit
MDFLWHKVSDKEKEDIKKQARGIMDSFSKKLSSVESKLVKDVGVEREQDEREELETKDDAVGRSSDFKKLMLENAPEKNEDFIIAEKGGWS